jgi:prolyl-tRNA synthetase
MTRLSESFFFTLREEPAEAVAISHRLLLRAGYIRPLAGTAGLYTYGPLCLRVLEKIQGIVRSEMDATGAQECLFPQMHPAEIWQESGRWAVYTSDGTMFTVSDGAREYGLGPTHEEAVCDFVRGALSSYRQLPFQLYQIQTKFRNEKRPRFGLMRGREFIMKDGYSFHDSDESLDKTYWRMHQAYNQMFTRIGLNFRPVEADSGAIGGAGSHEFMALADIGEDTILYCDQADYAANVEKALSIPPAAIVQENPGAFQKIATPNIKTVEEQAQLLKIDRTQIVKNVLYLITFAKGGTKPCLVSIRGDRQVNETKLKNHLDALDLKMATEEEVLDLTGLKPGYLAPDVAIEKCIRRADKTVQSLTYFSTGANENGYQVINARWSDQYPLPQVVDLDTAQEGDFCHLATEATLKSARGIELGHIFKLGTKYSKSMKVEFSDEKGKLQPVIMGCYGVGISRIPAAVIEQQEWHDEAGLIWPPAIAPYSVIIVPANVTEEAQRTCAEKLYQELTSQGMDTLLDDRDERAGSKFKDADLIGIPYRVTIGRDLKDGLVEVKNRKSGELHKIAPEEVFKFLREKFSTIESKLR